MRSARLFLASIVSVLSLSAPLVVSSAVSAVDLSQCNFGSQSEVLCDLAIKKEVKVNDGAYVDANTPGEAASAQIGDTITWKITVTNTLPSSTPEGDIAVTDAIPSGVSFVSATPSSGTFATDNWIFTVGNVVGEGYINYLPAELIIVTTANTVGLVENRADFGAYYCDGPCEYEDGNVLNNFDLAYVNVQPKPQVLGSTTTTPQVQGTTTLADTGSSNLVPSLVSLSIIGITLALGYLTRRNHKYSANR